MHRKHSPNSRNLDRVMAAKRALSPAELKKYHQAFSAGGINEVCRVCDAVLLAHQQTVSCAQAQVGKCPHTSVKPKPLKPPQKEEKQAQSYYDYLMSLPVKGKPDRPLNKKNAVKNVAKNR